MSHQTLYRLGWAVLGLIVDAIVIVYAWHVLAPRPWWFVTASQFATLRWWVIGYMGGTVIGLAFVLWRANKRP